MKNGTKEKSTQGSRRRAVAPSLQLSTTRTVFEFYVPFVWDPYSFITSHPVVCSTVSTGWIVQA